METITQKENINDIYTGLFKSNLEVLKKSSSEVINRYREDAMAAFVKSGFPGKKDEKYKYTFLEPLFNQNLKKFLEPRDITFDINDMFRCDIPELDTDMILLLNGFYYDREKPLKELPGGVIAGSLGAAAREFPSLFEKHYGKYTGAHPDSFAALNTAFAQDGVFIHVPENASGNKPVQIVNLLLSDEAELVQHRNLYIVDKNSQLNLVICDHTLSSPRFLTNSVTEIFVGDNAVFDSTRVQNEHNGSAQVINGFVHQEKDSSVTHNVITLHGGTIRNNLEVNINGTGAHNNSFGLFLTDQGQHVDNYTNIGHLYPNCTSNQLYKGVLDDFSTGVFSGKIHVHKDAQKTAAYQRSSNLLLTDDARVRTKPQLEIYADDVKCSHGATVGQLDTNALFYLQSRGINKKEAKLLMMNAFTHEIISQIKVEALRQRISELVNKRLRGELARCNNCSMQCG
ncbi:MAG: Fe-S cluster assembly protein SufD [Bacteroidales bacterium]